MHENEPLLPGLDPAATSTPDSGLRAAAQATIDELRAAGLLTGRHALTAQMLIATADRAGRGLHEARTTIATTNLLRLLADLLDKLPAGDETVSDAAARFLQAINDADAEARAAADGRPR